MKAPWNNGKYSLLLSLCLLVVFWAAPAAIATVREGNFQINLYGPEQISSDPALNDGYENTWYMYPIPPNSPVPPPFWNQWWYNDPYIRPGGKWIQVSFDYKLLNPEQPGDVFITINWTNGQWINSNAPPTWQNSTDPEAFIQRLSDPEYNLNLDNWRFHLNPGSPVGSWNSGKYWLPIDYNPEWVSVDVQGVGNVGIWNGVLLHECVPEPATLLLLSFGGLGLLGRKK